MNLGIDQDERGHKHSRIKLPDSLTQAKARCIVSVTGEKHDFPFSPVLDRIQHFDLNRIVKCPAMYNRRYPHTERRISNKKNDVSHLINSVRFKALWTFLEYILNIQQNPFLEANFFSFLVPWYIFCTWKKVYLILGAQYIWLFKKTEDIIEMYSVIFLISNINPKSRAAPRFWLGYHLSQSRQCNSS